jgi:hypothetical protein
MNINFIIMAISQIIHLILYLYIYCQVSIYGEIKLCKNCKNFIPYKNNLLDGFGVCKIFGTKISDKAGNEKMIYEFADHCRRNEYLCSDTGLFYELKSMVYDTTYNIIQSSKNVTDFLENNTTKPSKKYVEKKLDDDIKKMINEYYNYIRNDNDW